MKKLMIVTVACLISSAAMATEWMGWFITSGPNYRVQSVGPYSSEYMAQVGAKNRCERFSGVTCDKPSYIAIPEPWGIAAYGCQGDGFIGGAGNGNQVAVALSKAQNAGYSRRDCSLIYP